MKLFTSFRNGIIILLIIAIILINYYPIELTKFLSVVSSITAIFAVVVAIASWIQVYNSLKARLIFSIQSINRALYLEVKNVGQRVAYRIHFEMNEDFLNCIIGGLKKQFESVKINPFRLCGGDKRVFFIMPIDKNSSLPLDDNSRNMTELEMKELRDRFSKIEILINGEYWHSESGYKREKIKEQFSAIEYMPSSVEIPDPILECLKKIANNIT